jgi:ribonuclease D
VRNQKRPLGIPTTHEFPIENPLIVATDNATIVKVAEMLKGATVIGVDTEGSGLHCFRERTALVQISDHTNDYIIDPVLADDFSPLADIFADRSVVKIFHGADYDVVSLKRDFHFEVHNIFDTMISSQMLGLPKIGLADLIDRFFGVPIDKKYQKHDWTKRPLYPEHIEYARGDTHYLIAIRRLLLFKLEAAKRVHRVDEECRLIESREWHEGSDDPAAFLKIKGSNALDVTGKAVLWALYDFRQEKAARADRPSYKVIPNSVMLILSEQRPTSLNALEKLFPRARSMRSRYGKGLIAAVEKGLDDDRPIPAAPKKTGTSRDPRLTGKKAEALFLKLKDWRNAQCAREGDIAPVSISNNRLLKHIAQRVPKSLDELATMPEIRQWQIKDYGQLLLNVVKSSLTE